MVVKIRNVLSKSALGQVLRAGSQRIFDASKMLKLLKSAMKVFNTNKKKWILSVTFKNVSF
jgi:hypothetical protein